MCTGADERTHVQPFSHKPRRTRVRSLRLSRRPKRREEKIEKDMELKNLKLYMENISILEENEKLRKQASLLLQDNLALMSELQKRSSRRDFVSMALNKMPGDEQNQ